MSNLYWLTDEQMARLEPYFPKSHGRPRVDDRRVLSGIVFVNRNGLRWCDAPRGYLNAQGYKLRGKPFRHSNVDGILTRGHYSGTYYDRTSQDIDRLARPDEAIVVACPQIIAPDTIAAVAARRATAAPKVTAPRIKNLPVLLTGLLRCGMEGCGAGLTIRSGKGGGYGRHWWLGDVPLFGDRRTNLPPVFWYCARLRAWVRQRSTKELMANQRAATCSCNASLIDLVDQNRYTNPLDRSTLCWHAGRRQRMQ